MMGRSQVRAGRGWGWGSDPPSGTQDPVGSIYGASSPHALQLLAASGTLLRLRCYLSLLT